ncbi:MAG: cell surface protein, partial [Verrucomicrobia bacterium]|nr:cell surface protein [Verrucomicrobiota bacterium]
MLTLLAVGLTTFASAAPVAFDEVRAIFEGKCLECHNPDKTKGKLLMTTREAFLKGGEGGHALIGVDVAQSELIKRLTLPKEHDDIMPPKNGPLPAAEIDVIRRWVAEGAAWPA